MFIKSCRTLEILLLRRAYCEKLGGFQQLMLNRRYRIRINKVNRYCSFSLSRDNEVEHALRARKRKFCTHREASPIHVYQTTQDPVGSCNNLYKKRMVEFTLRLRTNKDTTPTKVFGADTSRNQAIWLQS